MPSDRLGLNAAFFFQPLVVGGPVSPVTMSEEDTSATARKGEAIVAVDVAAVAVAVAVEIAMDHPVAQPLPALGRIGPHDQRIICSQSNGQRNLSVAVAPPLWPCPQTCASRVQIVVCEWFERTRLKNIIIVLEGEIALLNTLPKSSQ